MKKEKPKTDRNGYAPSIMQTEKECYITGSDYEPNLIRHEIFWGNGRREISKANGLWVWLLADWHTDTDYCVHNDDKLRKRLERECQTKYEETHSREEFMRLIRKNYL